MSQSEPIHPNVFNDHLFTPACQLVKDSVPNIRMTIAGCFALVLTSQLTDPQRYKITVIILRKMLSDSDRDVRDIAKSCDLPDNEDDSDTSEYSLRNRAIDRISSNFLAFQTAQTKYAQPLFTNLFCIANSEIFE